MCVNINRQQCSFATTRVVCWIRFDCRVCWGLQVNAGLAAKLMEEEGGAEEDSGKKKAKAAGQTLLADERFQTMFTDPAFTIDENTEEYRLLHPNAGQHSEPSQCPLRLHLCRGCSISKSCCGGLLTVIEISRGSEVRERWRGVAVCSC